MKVDKKHILVGLLIILLIIIWKRVFYNVRATQDNYEVYEKPVNSNLENWTIARKQRVPMPNIYKNPFNPINKVFKKSKPVESKATIVQEKKKIKSEPEYIPTVIVYNGSIKGDKAEVAYLSVKGKNKRAMVKDSLCEGIVLLNIWSDSIKIREHNHERVISR